MNDNTSNPSPEQTRSEAMARFMAIKRRKEEIIEEMKQDIRERVLASTGTEITEFEVW